MTQETMIFVSIAFLLASLCAYGEIVRSIFSESSKKYNFIVYLIPVFLTSMGIMLLVSSII